MARYKAPAHVTSIFLSSGEHAVVRGVADLPDRLTDGDRIGLAANGFVAVPAEAPNADIAKKKA